MVEEDEEQQLLSLLLPRRAARKGGTAQLRCHGRHEILAAPKTGPRPKTAARPLPALRLATKALPEGRPCTTPAGRRCATAEEARHAVPQGLGIMRAHFLVANGGDGCFKIGFKLRPALRRVPSASGDFLLPQHV